MGNKSPSRTLAGTLVVWGPAGQGIRVELFRLGCSDGAGQEDDGNREEGEGHHQEHAEGAGAGEVMQKRQREEPRAEVQTDALGIAFRMGRSSICS